MKSLLSVAQLDIRRLGAGVVSLGLFAGLIPSLSSGLASPVPIATVLAILLLLVGAVAGGTFGGDFFSGRSSFYFARPLRASTLIGGRALALLLLASAAVAGAFGSYWLASSERASITLPLVPASRIWLLIAAYAAALYSGLAVAAGSRRAPSPSFWRPRILGLVRVSLFTTAFMGAFGLVGDLVIRAYAQTPTPLEILMKLSIAALFGICVATIAWGRADSSRLRRFQDLLTAIFMVLVCVLTAGAWNIILHPDPADITAISGVGRSPDGGAAFVSAVVHRGDPRTFRPVFRMDLADRTVSRFNVDPDQGPWMSPDGRIMAWSEATPFFFRPLVRAIWGTDTYRVKPGSGEIRNLPLPKQISASGFNLRSLFRSVTSVQPANDGERFAIRWGQHLTITTLMGGGEVDIEFRAGSRSYASSVWLADGSLRVATSRREAGREFVEFFDLDPATGRETPMGPTVEGAQVHFDRAGARALVIWRKANGRATLSLAEMERGTGAPAVLVDEAIGVNVLFLADGRIAVAFGVRGASRIALFSAHGSRLWSVDAPDQTTTVLGTEMFPGVLGVGLFGTESRELALVDCAEGRIVRRVPSFYALPGPVAGVPPASPASRLLASRDALFELPSPEAEPRQILPLPKR